MTAKSMSRQGSQDGKLATEGSALATSLVPAGWSVVEDVAPSNFDVAKLRPRTILRDGESRIGGDKMRPRVPDAKANWGLADGARILDEQTRLSRDFDGMVIPLPGTVLHDQRGFRRLGFLCQDAYGGRWCLFFDYLGLDWHDFVPFATGE